MGKNNRARRAAKTRDRKRRGSGRGDRSSRSQRRDNGDEPWIPVGELIDGLVEMAPARLAAGDRQFAELAAGRLCECPRNAVVRAVEAALTGFVARLFTIGWQPVEVVRQARRDGGTHHAVLAATAIVAHRGIAMSEPIDPRWQRQLDEVASCAADRGHNGCSGWFADWSDDNAPLPNALMMSFELLVTLRSLPPIEELVPPPGSQPTGAHAAPPTDLAADDRALLERVRHLLDKAESTEFEAEAEAFTAKAHELITRHAIDTALLADDVGPNTDEHPVATRVDIDDPYADAKSLLLQIVAEANRCRTVYHERLAFSTVLGFAADLAATELLYTSLLVQAQSALAAAGRNAPPGARTRSRSYRSAFLVAYANRIGQRLDEINQHLVDEAVERGCVAGAAIARRRSPMPSRLAIRTWSRRPCAADTMRPAGRWTQAADRATSTSPI
ncbi:MAG: DUF2786 domain-containing protein [Ilumatobacteraceae bacterium]